MLSVHRQLQQIVILLSLVFLAHFPSLRAAEPQTIQFTPPARLTWSTTPLILTATASSGLPVTFSVVSGPGVINNGNELTFTAAGSVRVRAEQAGNEQYSPASIERVITVEKATQTLDWPGLQQKLLAQNFPYPLQATASSGLPVTFRVDVGPAIIENGRLIVTNIGGIRLVAEPIADPRYEPVSITRTYNMPASVTFREVGSWTEWEGSGGEASEIRVAGNYAYVAGGAGGMLVVDVQDKTNPRIITSVDTVDAFGLALAGNYAYIADIQEGLVIADISNPLSPARIATVSTPGKSRGVAVGGGYAYVADTSTVRVFDVRSPANPIALPSIPSTNSFKATLDGTYLYFSDESNLRLYDVSNPSAPVPLGSITFRYPVMNIVVSGTYAYIANRNEGLKIIDTSDPLNLMAIGQYDPGTSTGSGTPVANSVALSGNTIFMNSFTTNFQSGGIDAINVSNPAQPTLLATAPTRGVFLSVTAAGNYAYVALGKEGIEIVDMSSSSQPGVVSHEPTEKFAARFAFAGNHLYLTDGRAGLRVIDISNPSTPTLLKTISTDGPTRDVAVRDNLAFVISNSMDVYNVTDPANPQLLGREPLGEGTSIAFKNEFGFVSGFRQELTVYDLTNPADPWDVNYLDYYGGFRVRTFGDFAVLFSGYITTVVDITTPRVRVLRLIGTYSQLTSDAARDGQYLFFSRSDGGLEVADATTPSRLASVAFLDTGGSSSNVFVSGMIAYLASGTAGVQVIDVSTPAAPLLLNTFDTAGVAAEAELKDNYIYIADGTHGLKIIEPLFAYKQTIYFEPPREVPISASPLTLEAFATSGLPVTFSVRSGPATISGNQLTLTGTGDVTIRARQAGNSQFAVWTTDRTITVVSAAPQVGVRESTGGTLEFFWPTASGYRLQRTDSLTPPNWQDVTEGVVVSGGESRVQVLPTGTEGYYRLVK